MAENHSKPLSHPLARPLTWKDHVLQFIKFVCFSLGAGIIEFGTFTLLRLAFPAAGALVACEVISVVLSCLFNYTINRKYTFGASNNLLLGMLIYGLYYAVATPVGAEFIVWLVKQGWNESLAKATKMVLNFFLDFALCKFVIFRLKKPKKAVE